MPDYKHKKSLKEILKIIKKYRLELKNKYGVNKIYIFGSYADNRETDKSDIDLLVEFERPIGLEFVDLCDYLEDLLNNKVDVLTPAMLQHNEYLWEEVKKELISV